jgi:hypothetical protein
MCEYMKHPYGGATLMIEMANGEAIGVNVYADPVDWRKFYPNELVEMTKAANGEDMEIYERKVFAAMKIADLEPRTKLNYSNYFWTPRTEYIPAENREDVLATLRKGVRFHYVYLPSPWDD